MKDDIYRYGLIVIIVAVILMIIIIKGAIGTSEIEDKIKELKKRQEENPGKSEPFYTEQYYMMLQFVESNYNQNRIVYYLSVTMIAIGFLMLMTAFAIMAYMFSENTEQLNNESLIKLFLPGVLTEFIAGTILVVYKLISNQAITYFESLKIFNMISASLRAIDDIVDDDLIKNKTRSEVAKLIIESSYNKSSASNKE